MVAVSGVFFLLLIARYEILPWPLNRCKPLPYMHSTVKIVVVCLIFGNLIFYNLWEYDIVDNFAVAMYF